MSEEMLDAVQCLLDIEGVVAVEQSSWNTVELLALGFKLHIARPVTKLRSIVEGWDRKTLIQELY